MISLRDRASNYFKSLQSQITQKLENYEPSAKFKSVVWQRPGGGGGESRLIAGGEVFEKAGVNFSRVEGELPPLMVQKLGSKSSQFFATGISLVLHPFSPRVPTIHANFRYFEQPDRAWFGGGVDLTPYVESVEDFQHFHRTLKNACDSFSKEAYAEYKKYCDEYFFIQHREERRGIGGIFFDYLSDDLEKKFEFAQACGNSFLESYCPIVDRNKNLAFTERQKKFQLLRRGRYVEFNLVYDRGTLFGLQTKGNIESILMSLPSVVHFDYQAAMEEDESEKNLMSWFRQPRDWI